MTDQCRANTEEPTLREMMRAMDAKLDRMLVHVEGVPGDTAKGLLTRVDRIEQRELARQKWTWAAVGLAGSALVAALRAWLSGGRG